MLVIGILCLLVAVISYFRYLSEKNGNTNKSKENSKNEAKWQRGLTIIFLILGLILTIYAIVLHRF
ncbi:hypothetical protein [Lactobacillus ultunensis]|uniref:Uncharacterized protein n=1 Tax=Lactobacillus ultunensis DSM 16047 TaxID=525365 RepID=C2EPA3_9LACO|nr:hypothetical protein [Lactobacillus ultunensis]EEJ71646.1 hypothetical protein HMPREF0548_1499 [Lactobacillus ultunensis DSM 16047]KRL80261.1 hypothetical protein FC57_GL001536 [Lactobacillus ultunensis DSM 16047]QQP28420.1 hypothetical protein H4B44_10065 [Lactobacillus ultunensis]